MGNTVLTTVRRNDRASQATSQNRTSFVNAARLRLARSDVRDAPAGGTECSAAVARDEWSTEPRAVRLLPSLRCLFCGFLPVFFAVLVGAFAAVFFATVGRGY